MPVRTLVRLVPLTLVALAGCRDSTGPRSSCGDAAVSLAPGEIETLTGTDAGDICIAADDGGGVYMAIVHHANDASATINLTARRLDGATAIVMDDRTALPARSAVASLQGLERLSSERDDRFHAALRRRERRLATMIPGARAVYRARAGRDAMSPRLAIGTDDPQVGDLVTINAQSASACSNPIDKQGRIAAISERAIVVHDTENPTGGFTDPEYADIAATFDTLIDPMAVANFGAPEDIDANGKVFIFYTNEVNKLTEKGSGSYIGGFYFVRDLFPRVENADFQGCPTSNEAEVFYMLVPDPEGTFSDPRSKDFVLRVTLGTIAHEYQHLINASRRMYVNNAFEFEETWLDEGLAHIAEELTFFEAANLPPGGNLDLDDVRATASILEAFNRYGINNFFRFEDFLLAPSSNSPYNEDDELATRGAAWHFLRYAADRRGGNQATFWHDLVNNTATGLTNLASVIGPVEPWFRDWASSILVDDLVGAAPATLQFPSWNLRSIWTADPPFSGSYVLATTNLSSSTPVSRNLIGGGASYFRLVLGSGAVGELQIRSDGETPGTDVSVTVVRTQ